MKQIYKTIFQNILIILFIIFIIALFCFCIGFVVSRETKNTFAKLGEGVECPNTVNQALEAKCNCPKNDFVLQVGATDEIKGQIDKIILPADVKQIQLLKNIYSVSEIQKNVSPTTAIGP